MTDTLATPNDDLLDLMIFFDRVGRPACCMVSHALAQRRLYVNAPGTRTDAYAAI